MIGGALLYTLRKKEGGRPSHVSPGKKPTKAAEGNKRPSIPAKPPRGKPAALSIQPRELSELRDVYLEALKAKEQRLNVQARRVSTLTEAEGQFGLLAAREIKKHGLAMVTPDMLAMARAFAPEWVEKKGREERSQRSRLKKPMGQGANSEEIQMLLRLPEQTRKEKYALLRN